MKYLPILFIVLATVLVSCKKEPQSAVSGKWQETKLVINVYSANVVAWDTTYLSPFTRFDYIQFNDNGTCIIGGDFYLTAESGGSKYSKPVQSPPGTSNFDYSSSGSVYVLTSTISQVVSFGGARTTDTVSIHGNTMLLHVVNYFGVGVNSTYDSYFTRQ
jgi:hypothetical protein